VRSSAASLLGFAAAILIVSLPAVCRGQDTTADRGTVGRLRYDYQQHISDRLRGFTVASYEQLLDNDSSPGYPDNVTARGGLSYDLRSWLRLEGGMGTYYSWRDVASDLFEARLWQAVTVDWPEIRGRARWLVHHRFMLEERFQFADQNQTSVRGRYRLSFTVPINRYTVEPGAFYMPVEGELFWDIGDTGSDAELFANEASVEVGLGYQFNNVLAVEVRYRWEESRDTMHGDITRDDNLLELRIKSTTRIVDFLKSR
jgi:hypothetical protein